MFLKLKKTVWPRNMIHKRDKGKGLPADKPEALHPLRAHLHSKPSKRLLRPKSLRIALVSLCAALLIAAAVIFYVQWEEGEAGARNAEALLSASHIETSTAEADGDSDTFRILPGIPLVFGVE